MGSFSDISILSSLFILNLGTNIFTSFLKMLQWKEKGTVKFYSSSPCHDFINEWSSLTGLFSTMKRCSLIDLSHSYKNSFYTFEDGHWWDTSQLVLLNSFKLYHSSYTIKPLMSLVFSSKSPHSSQSVHPSGDTVLQNNSSHLLLTVIF